MEKSFSEERIKRIKNIKKGQTSMEGKNKDLYKECEERVVNPKALDIFRNQ